MRILYLITKPNWGGAQKYVYELATSLPKESYKVEVMAGGEGPLTQKLWDAGIHAEGSLPVRNNISISENVRSFFKLYSLLRKQRPDVLHLNSSQIGIVGSLAGRLARVPRIVFTIHGWAFNEDRSFTIKALLRLFYWLAILACDQTIAVSEAVRQQTRNWPWIKGRLTVIHNGIAHETGFSKANARLELTRLKPELKRALEGASESAAFLVGTIAELHPIKGYAYAIRAIADCVRSFNTRKKILYAIIGEGTERPHLEALIKELGMEKHILLLGHVDGAAQYANAFDAFLLASLSEGLGYVLLEAGAAGVPVVATAVGGIPEIIDDMSSGILVRPRDHRELAHAIAFMIEHPDERRAYGAALREKVLRDFSLEKMVRETEGVYGEK